MKKLSFVILLILGVILGQPGHFGPGHEKARMIKKWKLIEYLDLSEEQSEKFFLRVNSFEKKAKEIHKKERKVREELYDFLDQESVKDKDVTKLIEEYYDLKTEITNLRKKHHTEIGDILSTEQQIKYAVFEHKFKKKMKDKFLEKHGH